MSNKKVTKGSGFYQSNKKPGLTKKRVEDISLLLCVVLLIVSTFKCIEQYDTIVKQETMISELNTGLNEATAYVSELKGDLVDATAVIDSMSQTIEDLKSENERLASEFNSIKDRVDGIEKYFDENSVTPTVSRNTTLDVNTTMTTERMNYIIDCFEEVNNKQSGFKGHGKAFITASKITGLDPVFILSLSNLESNFGTSTIAINKGNFMGIGAYDDSPYSSALVLGDSVDQGIINGAIWVKEHYYDNGQDTLNEMIYGPKSYCTRKEHWINSIVSLMNTSYKYASQSDVV